ncbi:MAG: hypothetical protein K6T83_11790 [Alicyclobacillus sp.]|nr:hypothetical protein [Alicyclobacillus sp.]
MKKILVSLVVLAAIIVGGGWYAKREVINTVSHKVVTMLNSPTTQAQINKALSSPKVESLIRKYASQDTGGLSFNSQQEAVQFVLSHLSPGEELKLIQAYNHRDSLTIDQKKALANQVLAQFSPQQLAAIARTFEQGNGQ